MIWLAFYIHPLKCILQSSLHQGRFVTVWFPYSIMYFFTSIHTYIQNDWGSLIWNINSGTLWCNLIQTTTWPPLHVGVQYYTCDVDEIGYLQTGQDHFFTVCMIRLLISFLHAKHLSFLPKYLLMNYIDLVSKAEWSPTLSQKNNFW